MGNYCKRKHIKEPIQDIEKDIYQIPPPENYDFESQNQIQKEDKINTEVNEPEEIKKEKKEIKPEENIFEDNSVIEILEDVKVGLKNLGGTCYINSSLQCLSNTKKLTNYFLTKFKYEPNNKNKIICNEFYKIINYLWNYENNNNPFSPNDFIRIISQDNSYKGNKSSDSKDVIIFLLDKLHKELNIIKDVSNDNEDYDRIINNQNIILDKDKLYEIFEKYYNKNYNSIISHLFYGIREKKIKFKCCNTIKYNYDVYSYIEFPLEKISKALGNITDINLLECFQYYKEEQYITGKNKINCNKCQTKSDVYITSSLISMANYLCIILNRDEGNSYKYKVIFPESLNLFDYIDKKQDKEFVYNLYAIISHQGTDANNGHFYAYCKHRINNKWYLYNDSIVSECEKNDDYLNGVSYILFYQSLEIPQPFHHNI